MENFKMEKVNAKDFLGKEVSIEIDRKLGFCKDFTASLKRKDTWKHLTKDIDFT